MSHWLSDLTNPDFRDMWYRLEPDCAQDTENCWSQLKPEARAWWADATRIYFDSEAKGMRARAKRIKSIYAEQNPGGTWAWFDEYQEYIRDVDD